MQVGRADEISFTNMGIVGETVLAHGVFQLGEFCHFPDITVTYKCKQQDLVLINSPSVP